MTLILVALLLLGGAAALVLSALEENIAFFVSPSDVAANDLEPGKRFRLGGLVVDGSVAKHADGSVTFSLTDMAHEVPVVYKGILPHLFREGQGIITQGSLQPDGVFRAAEVLAKHDETYMPKEVADALKESGHWQPESGTAQ